MLPPFYCQGYKTQKEGRTHIFVKQSTTKESIHCKVNSCYAFCELQQQNARNKNKTASYPHSPLTSGIPYHRLDADCMGKLQPPRAALYFRSFWKYPAGKIHRQRLDTEHTLGKSCSQKGRVSLLQMLAPLYSQAPKHHS